MNNFKYLYANSLTTNVLLVVFYLYFKEHRIHLEGWYSTNRLL